MKKMCYYVECDSAAELAINEIRDRIPCFINTKLSIDGEYMTFEIECREQDIPFVERMIAPFV